MGRLYLTVAFILAGSSVIAASFISAYLPTFTTTFLSLVLASLTAVLFCGKNMYDTAKCLSRKTWTVAAFSGIIPISSTFFSVTILKESISMYQAAGCVLVVFATLIISYQKKAA